uniref:Intraflagellar transport 80 homolog (Chlamydomonas) n=1 Tax=Eptatretus burgeri TaxID=7764 RepID=A0A8C4PYQ4_EPTBU
MRLKTSFLKDSKHILWVKSFWCVGWLSANEAYSCGDDRWILCWNTISGEPTKLLQLPDFVFPLHLHWFPRTATSVPSSSKKAITNELFALSTTDGKYHLVSRSGHIEKSVDAHRGAALCVCWSYDGTALATVGEDGLIKIWSRTGMLRSTLAQQGNPVYSVAWSPDSDRVAFTTGQQIIVKPLQPNTKPLQWKAHDGVVLKVDWNPLNGLIVSGGEDCRYKVWDSYGQVLYTSAILEYPVTAVAWAPNGDYFAVGSFNSLRLCNKAGWSHCVEKHTTGSTFGLAWAPDGTRVAAACGDGHVIFAHMIGQRWERGAFELTLSKRRTIQVRNVLNDALDLLEFRDPVVKASFDFGYLIVTTSLQCYIYSIKNWNTPVLFDLKEGSVGLIVQSPKHFLLAEAGALHLYSYEGRSLPSPLLPVPRLPTLGQFTVSLCSDTLAVRDPIDGKVVHLFDTVTGRPLGIRKPLQHKLEVQEVALEQVGPPAERKLAFVDSNQDVYLAHVRLSAITRIGGPVSGLAWHVDTSLLCGLQDHALLLWLCPGAAFIDPQLLPLTQTHRDSPEVGKAAQLLSFSGSMVQVRRADGALIQLHTLPYPGLLHTQVTRGLWPAALRLCRSAKLPSLWAVLSVLAIQGKQLKTAELAYAAIGKVDKVLWLRQAMDLPSEAQQAKMLGLGSQANEVDHILTQVGVDWKKAKTTISVETSNPIQQ